VLQVLRPAPLADLVMRICKAGLEYDRHTTSGNAKLIMTSTPLTGVQKFCCAQHSHLGLAPGNCHNVIERMFSSTSRGCTGQTIAPHESTRIQAQTPLQGSHGVPATTCRLVAGPHRQRQRRRDRGPAFAAHEECLRWITVQHVSMAPHRPRRGPGFGGKPHTVSVH